MPRILLTVPETQEGIARPVIYDVAAMLFRYTGLNPNTNIFFPGDQEVGKQLGSYLNLKGDDPNFFAFNDKVTIEFTETYEQDRLNTTATHQAENEHIFNDRELGVNIRPIYSSADVVVTFKYRGESKTRVQRWRDDIRVRFAAQRFDHIFAATYHYLVPPKFLEVLKVIHSLRENMAGYNQCYEDYFKEFTTPLLSELTNLAGKANYIAVSETQGRITGMFDFEGAPEEGAKTENGDPWEISFNYKFRYDKAIACVMNYPIIIHNQIIPAAYRNTRPAFDLLQVQKRYTLSSGAFEHFSVDTKYTTPNSEPGLTIPAYDEYLPLFKIPNTMRIFNGLILLDTNHLRDLMNLAQPGNYIFAPDILALLKSEAIFMPQIYGSIFALTLYQNDRMMDPKFLRVDQELNVTANIDLNLRKQYHLRLGVVTDLRLINNTALDRLCANASATIKLLKLIDCRVKLCPVSSSSNRLNKNDLLLAISKINGSINNVNQFRNMQTVMTLTIQSNRIEENHATSIGRSVLPNE